MVVGKVATQRLTPYHQYGLVPEGEGPHNKVICRVSILSQSVTFEIASFALRPVRARMQRCCSHVLETVTFLKILTSEGAYLDPTAREARDYICRDFYVLST